MYPCVLIYNQKSPTESACVAFGKTLGSEDKDDVNSSRIRVLLAINDSIKSPYSEGVYLVKNAELQAINLDLAAPTPSKSIPFKKPSKICDYEEVTITTKDLQRNEDTLITNARDEKSKQQLASFSKNMRSLLVVMNKENLGSKWEQSLNRLDDKIDTSIENFDTGLSFFIELSTF